MRAVADVHSLNAAAICCDMSFGEQREKQQEEEAAAHLCKFS
jgi:hypothetical protein